MSDMWSLDLGREVMLLAAQESGSSNREDKEVSALHIQALAAIRGSFLSLSSSYLPY